MSDTSGSYANKYGYLPFGGSYLEIETIANPFQFVGQTGAVADGASSFAMGARFYSPASGRFISRDPISAGGGVDRNAYRYVYNDPLDRIDPLGLDAAQDLNRCARRCYWGCSVWLIPCAVGIPGGCEAFLHCFTDCIDQECTPCVGPQCRKPNTPQSCKPCRPPDCYGADPCKGVPPGPVPTPTPPFQPGPGQPVVPVTPVDPNALYGPTGYGAANFVTDIGGTFAYRITFENDPRPLLRRRA